MSLKPWAQSHEFFLSFILNGLHSYSSIVLGMLIAKHGRSDLGYKNLFPRLVNYEYAFGGVDLRSFLLGTLLEGKKGK